MARNMPATPQEAQAQRPAKKRSATRRKAAAAPREAHEIGLGRSVTFLSHEAFKAFEAAIAEPAKPNAALRELMERGRRLRIDD